LNSVQLNTGQLKMKCPACGESATRALFRGTDRLYGTTSEQFQVAKCVSCGLLRLDPPPEPAELPRYYPDEYWYAPRKDRASELEEAYRRLVLRDHVNFVVRALADAGEAGMVLDVGCGGGLFLGMLQERGFQVLGLDNSQAAAQAAWTHHRVTVIRGDLANSPITRESCAAVTMFHVLEHLYDPESYLRSARDLLCPGGRLIVQVPNASSWQCVLFGERWNGLDIPRHLVNYREQDLDRLLEHCGFEIVRRKHFSLRDNPAGFASSVSPGLDPMARRVRKIPESAREKVFKDLLYFGLVLGALPFTALEAACGAGSTIMLEARKKA
jgi:SAM-dependent methyltransferase